MTHERCEECGRLLQECDCLDLGDDRDLMENDEIEVELDEEEDDRTWP